MECPRPQWKRLCAGALTTGLASLGTGTPAANVGLVASRRCAAAARTALQDAEVDEASRSSIVSPAGLDSSAESLEEIALSILAQIVQVRRTSGPRELPVSADTKAELMKTDVVCGMQVDWDSPIRTTMRGGRSLLLGRLSDSILQIAAFLRLAG